MNHEAEPFRPRLNTQVSAYTKHQMELCEQIKNVLVIDDSHDDFQDDSQDFHENQENTTSPRLNLPNTSSSVPQINIDLGSMFPTPNTDLKEVNDLKITTVATADFTTFDLNHDTTFDSNSSLSNSTFLQEKNSQNWPEPKHIQELSAVGIITDNEVDRQVKSEIRGGKSWMTKEILVGIEERDRLFLEMKIKPSDRDVEESYKKKRNHVVTLTRRAKRDMKTKIRPAVESSIKLNIREQVEKQGLEVVSREVQSAAMNIVFKNSSKMHAGQNSGRETPTMVSGRSTPLVNTPVRSSIDSNEQLQPLNWKTIAKTYKNFDNEPNKN